MKHIWYITFLVFLSSCTEGASYFSFNPPMNGVVIDGDASDTVNGYKEGTISTKPPENCENYCKLSSSNESFFTLTSLISSYKDNNYAFEFKTSQQDVFYFYNVDLYHNLARDTINYKDGMWLKNGSSTFIASLRDENFLDITDRGVIPLDDKKQFELFFQAKFPINLQDMKVCQGYFDDKSKDLIDDSNKICYNFK